MRIPAYRHRIRIARCQAALADGGGQGEVRFDLQTDFTVERRDQNQLVSQHVMSSRRLNQVSGLQVIHPLEIGRKKHIGARTIFDLTRQRRTGGKGEAHRD